jgi:ribosomal protein S18 acetylase RimI-like enzyme
MKLAQKTRFHVRAAVMSDIPQLARIQFKEQKEILQYVGMTQVSMKELTKTRDFYRVRIEDKEAKLVVAEDKESGTIVGMGLGRVKFSDEYVALETGEIAYLWIEPAYRKTEMAEDIVAELAPFFKAHGAHSLTVSYAKEDLEAETLWGGLHFKPVWVTAAATLEELQIPHSEESGRQ